jgi:hypothetical protein
MSISLNFDSRELTVLLCPNCGGGCTHHTVVDVYSRGEDAEATRTRVGDDEMAPIGNPSSRRSGLNIGFYCENCPQRFWLCIQQHKGSTYVTVERGELEPQTVEDLLASPAAEGVDPEAEIDDILAQI